MVGDIDSLILTLIREVDFRILIGKTCFIILSVTKEEDTQILMILGYFILMEILILNHPRFGLMKFKNYLT